MIFALCGCHNICLGSINISDAHASMSARAILSRAILSRGVMLQREGN
jgi:hypothetical protein